MQYIYRPINVCSKEMYFSINEDHTIHDVQFVGGCDGNLKGIAKLVEGMKAEDVIEKIKGTTCGKKNTSCPDQFAIALQTVLKKQG